MMQAFQRQRASQTLENRESTVDAEADEEYFDRYLQQVVSQPRICIFVSFFYDFHGGDRYG